MRLLTAVSLVRVQQGEFFHIRLLGQAVKTSPFHGGNTGSIPVGVIGIVIQYADVAQFNKIDYVNRRQSLITNQLLCRI